MPDFTDCNVLRGKAYGGANGSKIPIEYCGEQYMLKFPPSAKNKPTELSYTNGCINEYIGSHIFNSIGIKAHDTMLGTYTVGGKEKVVCACKDFTADGHTLYDFSSIKNTIIDSVHAGAGTELSSIAEAMEKQTFVDPQKLKEFFWDTFVVDALIGNFDRHNGNWGFLVDNETGEVSIAPIFDCGSSLLPQADAKTMEMVLNNPDEMDKRIYLFPTSAIKYDGKKINYYNFMVSGESRECSEAILRIAPAINMSEINNIIDNTPYISDLQKDFCHEYVNARYAKIIEPAYEIAKNTVSPYFTEKDEDILQEIMEGIQALEQEADIPSFQTEGSDVCNRLYADVDTDVQNNAFTNQEIDEEDFGAI